MMVVMVMGDGDDDGRVMVVQVLGDEVMVVW